MRLKSIKLAGFKSFVDPTTVSLPSNMAAVVGPNGCGKSNIIDAVRWVMGESSAKNLRGESMADVIFNGSVNRQPVGQASIELVFDNSDGGIGGEYASYAEISTKRVVARDGQSEYFLNGARCRRRDITDIFLGTGLGPRSYAIIEQGMISRLIESKPEELRVFIEEAAGISKYKERRRETESRMRRTLENLERLTDLRDELERQLQHLQRQAQAAEKYSEFKQQERQLKAELQALEWRQLDLELVDCNREVGELEVRLEQVNAEHQQVETALESLRVEQSERGDVFNQAQGRYYSLGAEVARLEQNIKHQRERAQQMELDLTETRDNLTESRQHLVEDQRRLSEWQAELDQIAPELERLQAAETASAGVLAGAEQSMQDWQSRWDEFNGAAAAPQQEAEVQQSRIRHLEHSLQRLQNKASSLQQEQATLQPLDNSDELAALQQSVADSENQMQALEQRSEVLTAQLREQRADGQGLSGQLDSARSRLQQLRGRQSSLEALQQATQQEAQATGDWLQAQGLAERPRLLQNMQVEDGWQLAVETVLGAYLQAVCVDEVAALTDELQSLAEGRVVLLEAKDIPAAHGSLASRVQCSGFARGLLSGVRTAGSLAEAMALRDSLAPHESVVTPEGEWIGSNWLRWQRGEAAAAGVIQRAQELEALAAAIAEQEAIIDRLQQQIAAAESRLRELESESQQASAALQRESRAHAEHVAALQAHRARHEEQLTRRERIQNDIDETAQLFAAEQQAIAEARSTLATAIERMEADSGQRESLLSERDTLRQALDEARQTARHDRDALHQAAMRHRSLQTQVETIRGSIERTDRQVTQLAERQVSLEQALHDSASPIEPLQKQLEEQLQLRVAAEAALSEARQQVADIEHRMREAEQERARIEQRAVAVRGELEQRRLKQQTLHVQQETVMRQLGEAQHEPEALLAQMPEEASASEWQLNLERVANRINRLGPINLAAIDEYAVQSERKQYLDSQHEDLESALGTLESAIRKIDKETRHRFQETFDKVNNGIQDLFPRVFGGGSAYLEMTGDDLLDTGISIMARPPGKKNSTIHLLSGGEKALTAIALVFSIFQLNPAPFCMLDEVDAPLDDANVGRYARMVKEMSEKVQFIFITHNKITMEMADQLLGVTMHEPGVSRLVTVDVEEAAELAAS